MRIYDLELYKQLLDIKHSETPNLIAHVIVTAIEGLDEEGRNYILNKLQTRYFNPFGDEDIL